MAPRVPPLDSVHEDEGANFTDFGGWRMPVDFGSIREEHEAVRDSVGVFDVSHMGEVEVRGDDAEELTQRLTTNDVTKLEPGESQYSTVTDENGILIDDTVVYCLDDGYLFVPNAGHDAEATERWTEFRDEKGFDAEVVNATDDYCMFAVQGPDSLDVVEDVTDERVDDLRKFEWKRASVGGYGCTVSRTGYTGEDGFEILVDADNSEEVWRAVTEPGNGVQPQPCGLGARDTLRLEMGYLLSGQDFDPDDNPRTPYEAGLGFVVDLGKEFVGREALREATEPEERIRGFVLQERGVPRHGYEIRHDGERVGEVTSGTMSPSLGDPIGMGYVPSEFDEGDVVDVVVRDEPKRARITETPFLEGYR